MTTDKKIFWLDGFEGKAKDGCFVRCNLNDRISNLEKNGARVVGIKYSEEDDKNLELIIEMPKDEG